MSLLSSDGFQRKVLWCAIRGTLLRQVPGAFSADAFGAEDGGGPGRAQAPRLRLARILESFVAGAGPGECPGAETMDYLVAEAGKIMSPTERGALETEWTAVRDLEPPSDPTFVANRLRLFLQHRALSRAVLQVADVLSKPVLTEEDMTAAKTLLAAPFDLGVDASQRPHPVLASAIDRISLWGAGDTALHIPTGLGPLDASLDGGPRVGEFFVLLAPPKGAKTSCAINIAAGGIRAGHDGLMVSYEMSQGAMLQRIDRRLAQATKMELREDPRRILQSVRGYKAAGAGEIWLQTESPQTGDACARALRMIETLRAEGARISFVILDFLNIMSGATVKQEREKRHELARVSRECSALAKESQTAVWSAALVKREAVNKARIRKGDIAESQEVIAVVDGATAICGTPEMRRSMLRRLYHAALRHEGDEKDAGLYVADIDRMLFKEASQAVQEDMKQKDEARAQESAHSRRRHTGE